MESDIIELFPVNGTHQYASKYIEPQTELVETKNKSVGQINEIYLKLVCHNFKVLSQSIFLLGIDVTRWLKDK